MGLLIPPKGQVDSSKIVVVLIPSFSSLPRGCGWKEVLGIRFEACLFLKKMRPLFLSARDRIGRVGPSNLARQYSKAVGFPVFLTPDGLETVHANQVFRILHSKKLWLVFFTLWV